MQILTEKLFFRLWRNQIFFYFLICAAFLLLSSQILSTFLFSYVFIVFSFIAVRSFYRVTLHWNDKSYLKLLLPTAFVVRIAAVFVLAALLRYFNGDYFVGGGDDANYYQASSEIYKFWKYGIVPLNRSGIRMATGEYSGYPIFGALMMRVLGDNIYAARIGNAVFSTLSVYLVYRICLSFACRPLARLVACIFTFYPLSVVFSAVQWKDTILLFLVLMNIYGVVGVLRFKRFVSSLFCTTVSLTLLIFFRPAVIFVLVLSHALISGYGLFRAMMFAKDARFYRNYVMLLASTVVLLVFAWIALSESGVVMSADRYYDSRSSISGKTLSETEAGAGKMDFAKFLGAPVYMASTVFLPVFTAVNLSVEHMTNIAFLPVVMHMALLPFFIIAIWNIIVSSREHAYANPVPLYLLICYVTYRGMQAFNMVSTFDARQSAPALTLMLLMLPFAFERPYKRKVFVLLITISIVVLLAVNLVRMRSHGLL